MRRCIALGMMVGALASSLSAEQEARAECQGSAMATANSLLAPGVMRIRWTINGQDFVGVLSGVHCDAFDAFVYDGKQREAVVLKLSELQSLQVQRRRRAGWKGGIIAMSLGAALGAALQSKDEPLQGALIGGLVAAPVGWHYPIRTWRPVELPRHALRE